MEEEHSKEHVASIVKMTPGISTLQFYSRFV